MHSKIKSVSEIIDSEDEFVNIRKKIKEMDVLESFMVIFPELKKIVIPKKLSNETLYLRVENSVWRSELKFKQNLIIEKINKHYKENIIKQIKFI